MRGLPQLPFLLVGLPLLGLWGCATQGPPAPEATTPEKAPPALASGPAQAPDGGLSGRALALFDDANQSALAAAKAPTPDDAALERKYDAARVADPRLAEADFNLGVLAERQGKREQAFLLYRAALDKKPSLKMAAEALARLTAEQGDVASAIAQWTDIANKFPDDAPSRVALAELYRQSGDHERCLEYARQALIRDPKSIAAYKVMLQSDRDRKQYSLAKLVGLRALKIDDKNGGLYVLLGQVQLAEGQPEQATVQFKKALDVKPDDRGALTELARLALADQDYAAAENALRRLVQAGGGTAEVQLALGVSYKGLGQADKALSAYDAAERLNGRLAAVYLDRGILFQRMKGAPDKALEQYKRYVVLLGGEQALPDSSPVPALRREAEQMVRAKAEARRVEEQARMPAPAAPAAAPKPAPSVPTHP
ncbi:MAG: adventurous gliding motility TPR repeat lipoprotein GltE [Myxococcaceae bacterium]